MAKTYTVQKIQELPRLTESGSVEKFLRVSATTQGGTSFTLDLPAQRIRPQRRGPAPRGPGCAVRPDQGALAPC